MTREGTPARRGRREGRDVRGHLPTPGSSCDVRYGQAGCGKPERGPAGHTCPCLPRGGAQGGPSVPCRLSTVYSGDLASSRDSATEIPESDVRLGAVDAPRITTPLLAGFLLGGDRKRGAVTAEDAHVEVWAGWTLRESGGGRGFVERRATCQVTRGARGHTWGNRFASQRAPSVLTVTFLSSVSVIPVQDHRAELSRPARGPCGSLRL